jgi:hypothetical protein
MEKIKSMKSKFTLLFAAALLLLTASCGKAEPASDNVTPTLETRIAAENYISPSSVYAAEDGTVYAADETGRQYLLIGSGEYVLQYDTTAPADLREHLELFAAVLAREYNWKELTD